MKKLMVAFAAVAMAISANAITYAWSTGPAIAYGDKSGENYYSGVYYLIQGDAAAAGAAVNAILAAGIGGYATEFDSQVAGAYNYGTYSTETYALSDLKTGEWSWDEYVVRWDSSDTAALPFYQLILDTANNGVYISEIGMSDYTTVGDTLISMGNEGQTTFGSDVKTYQGSGWYTVAAVPEPTSGLLLLLGVAGLALRRRRA